MSRRRDPRAPGGVLAPGLGDAAPLRTGRATPPPARRPEPELMQRMAAGVIRRRARELVELLDPDPDELRDNPEAIAAWVDRAIDARAELDGALDRYSALLVGNGLPDECYVPCCGYTCEPHRRLLEGDAA